MLLPQHVDSPIAADREEPFGQVRAHRVAILSAKTEKRVLDHVTRILGIAQKPGGIEVQGSLEGSYRLAHPRTLIEIRSSIHHLARKETCSRSTLIRPCRRFLRRCPKKNLESPTGTHQKTK